MMPMMIMAKDRFLLYYREGDHKRACAKMCYYKLCLKCVAQFFSQ